MTPDGLEVTLKKFSGEFTFNNNQSLSNPKFGVVLDTETTGFDQVNDKIIEIALRPFTYDPKNQKLTGVLEAYSGLEDPGFPLPKNISRITGLKNRDLDGKKINWSKVKEILDKSDIIISHHAAFDRPFIDRYVSYDNTVWACSIQHIDWAPKGFNRVNLETLCIYHGFFGDAHRALSDADMLLHLLSFQSPNSEKSYFSEILINSHTPYKLLSILDFPFEQKDELKKRGFRWNAKSKTWYKLVPGTYYDKNEIQNLTGLCNKLGAKISDKQIPLSENFKYGFQY